MGRETLRAAEGRLGQGLGGVGEPVTGDVIVLDHPFMRDRHVIAQVVKVGKVMWEIALWFRGTWEQPTRRKVGRWFPIEPGRDLNQLAAQLRQAHDGLVADEGKARLEYGAAVERIAQGIEADRPRREAGSVRKDESPVRQDAPNPMHNRPEPTEWR